MPNDEEIRQRILDAAEQCLLEAGINARIHAAIADRAGVSRPTVYKYVGDQNAVIEALLHREMARFLVAAEPLLSHRGPLRERFVDSIVFVVGYARGHALLQKGLRDEPAAVVPWFTVNAAPLIESAVEFFTPHLRQAIAEGEIPGVEPRAVVEWGYRILVSLVTTPSTLRIDDEQVLRQFIEGLLNIGMAAGTPVA